MADSTDDLLAAIRTNTDAITGLVAELQRLGGVLQKETKRPRAQQSVLVGDGDNGVPRATWLTPIIDAWEKEMGEGSFPMGQALKPLAQLRKKNTEYEIAKRIGYYCRDAIRRNEVKFMSIPKFAATFKTWAPDAPAWDGEDE
jgi:hypothetical protein